MAQLRPPGLILALLLGGCAGHGTRAPAEGYGSEVADGLQRLRSATRAFLSIDSAAAAGYPREIADCLVHEHHGAMGYHHVNRTYVDAQLDVEHPEILLYERLPDGAYRLNGVEFIVPYRAWPRDSVAPVIIGQPLKHEDNLKIWYLHVWAWTRNADGLFADFHPEVRCPPGSAKVFKPSSDEMPAH